MMPAMKVIASRLLLCLFASLGLMIFAQAAEPEPAPRMVKPEVFQKRYQRVGVAETMHVTEFKGVKDGVAILRISDKKLLGDGWKEEWIGVKLADLDPAFRAELEKAAGSRKE